MNWAEIELHRPWFLLLAVLPAALWILTWLLRHRQSNIADAHLLPWLLRPEQVESRLWHSLRIVFHLLLWLLLALTLSGPRIAQPTANTPTRSGVDILIALDVSRSMQTMDIHPSRLDRARTEILRLLDESRDDRIGLIIFRGRSLLLSPPTTDRRLLKNVLRSFQPDSIPIDGSDFVALFNAAQITLTQSANPAKALIIISDGEHSNTQTRHIALAQATRLANSGIPIFALGVGTLQGATLPDDKQTVLRVQQQTVISKLDESFLRQVANYGKGQYTRLSDSGASIIDLYYSGIRKLSTYSIDTTAAQNMRWREIYYLPLSAALFVLVALIFHSRSPTQNRSAIAHRALTSILIIFLCSCANGATPPTPTIQQAFDFYRLKRFPESLKAYGLYDNFLATMGAGNSAYRLGLFQEAARFYRQAFYLTDPHEDYNKAIALFNMGNAYFRLQEIGEAMRLYADALKYYPTLAPAKINLALSTSRFRATMRENDPDGTLTSRVGRGAQYRRSLSGLEMKRGSSVMIDDQRSKEFSRYRYEGNESKTQDLNQYTGARNKDNITVTADANTLNSAGLRKFSLEALTQLVANRPSQEHLLWRRLFFYENKVFIPDEDKVLLPQHNPW